MNPYEQKNKIEKNNGFILFLIFFFKCEISSIWVTLKIKIRNRIGQFNIERQ